MSDQQQALFENGLYTVSVEEKPGCQVTLKVHASKEQTQKNYKQAVKKINKEVSVPGFRKGKAPDSTVIKNYNTYVEQEWKEIIVNDALQHSINLAKIYPLRKESLQRPKIDTCSLENGADLTIQFERYPAIPYIDFTTLHLSPLEKAVVAEEKVTEMIEEIQRSQADWETITGRPVQEGDYVDITIDAIDQEPPKSIVKDRRFEVSDKMVGWLRRLLIGMEAGQVAEAVSELDPNSDQEMQSTFKPTHCRVTLNSILKILPHEVNEQLATKTGASSLDDLKNKITRNLQQEAEFEAKQKQYAELENALLAQYSFEVPQSMTESERRWRIKEKIRALKNKNFLDEEIKQKEQSIEEEVVKETDEALRLYFLSKQIVQQGNLSISNQELNQELIRHMRQNPSYHGKESSEAASQELISQLANNLLQHKAKEYVLSQVATYSH